MTSKLCQKEHRKYVDYVDMSYGLKGPKETMTQLNTVTVELIILKAEFIYHRGAKLMFNFVISFIEKQYVFKRTVQFCDFFHKKAMICQQSID